MEVRARLRFLRMAPRKVRSVADLIRRLKVADAEYQLQFMSRDAALPILKLLKSAIANAENNNKLKKDNLFVKSVFVDQGPVLKRYRPRAFGRAAEIKKRSAHITIILDEFTPSTARKPKGTAKKTTKAKTAAIDRPVVDYKDIKHTTKGRSSDHTDDTASDQAASEHRRPAPGGKELFNRRSGEN